jgi:hypothetical protein
MYTLRLNREIPLLIAYFLSIIKMIPIIGTVGATSGGNAL